MKEKSSINMKSYIVGFVLSLFLTLTAYGVYLNFNALNQFLSLENIVSLLLTLAVVQLFVQLIFFMHLGHETGPRWKLVIFVGALMFILLIAIASLWIMHHLNYNMMPEDIEEYIMVEEGFYK